MSMDQSGKDFVGYLLSLQDRDNRGALAELRAALARSPDEAPRAGGHIDRYLPEGATEDDRRAYYLIGSLFGLYPRRSSGEVSYDRTAGSFGASARALKDESLSMEARFVALFEVDLLDLADPLRRAISLFKARDQSLNWFVLFDDILNWDRADRRLRWARDFYRAAPPPPEEEKREKFIAHLRALASDRAALAELRSGLGRLPREMARVHKHVAPYLPEKGRRDDHWYYLVATLFGLFPAHKDGVSFGEAFRALKGAGAGMERRFAQILSARGEDLGAHLRRAVALLKSGDHPSPFDWERLLSDLIWWESNLSDFDRAVQLRWARDFFMGKSAADSEASSDSALSESSKTSQVI